MNDAFPTHAFLFIEILLKNKIQSTHKNTLYITLYHLIEATSKLSKTDNENFVQDCDICISVNRKKGEEGREVER